MCAVKPKLNLHIVGLCWSLFVYKQIFLSTFQIIAKEKDKSEDVLYIDFVFKTNQK